MSGSDSESEDLQALLEVNGKCNLSVAVRNAIAVLAAAPESILGLAVEELPPRLQDDAFKAQELLSSVASRLASHEIAAQVQREMELLQLSATSDASEADITLEELPSELHAHITEAVWQSCDDRDMGRLLSVCSAFRIDSYVARMREEESAWLRQWVRLDGLPSAPLPTHARDGAPRTNNRKLTPWTGDAPHSEPGTAWPNGFRMALP